LRKETLTVKNVRYLVCLVALLGIAPGLLAEMKVGHADAIKNAVKKTTPDYNPLARQMKIQGEVEVEVKITEAGDVTSVTPITGNAMLTVTVVKAVKEWKFTPFTEGGSAVPAIAVMKFSFKL
jgi:TonB family protein